jgi:hypothetical protein
VASLNSVVNGKASSSLGAPTDVESGEIVIGSGDGEFALIYTGAGETSDRVMNLAGKNSTVTFDQSGTGLLKFTSAFTVSGYGHNKAIVLKPIFYSVLTPIGPGAIKNAVFSRFLRRVVPQNKDCVRIALDFDDMGWR